MDDPRLVHHREAVGYRGHQVDRSGNFHLLVARAQLFDPLLEAESVDALHDDEVESLVLADAMHGDDAGVGDRRERSRLFVDRSPAFDGVPLILIATVRSRSLSNAS